MQWHAGKRLLAHMLAAMIKTYRERGIKRDALMRWRHRAHNVRTDAHAAVAILHNLRKQLVEQQLWAVMTFWRRFTMHKRSERLGVRGQLCTKHVHNEH